MSIGDKIKKLREEQNLTLEEVGKRTGTTKQTISRYESGEISTIPYDRIELLAKCFKVHPGYIMGWQDDSAIMETANKDLALSNMSERLKDYALLLSQMPSEQQEHIISLIDMLNKNNK